jgi:hypothetical protein
MGAGIVWTSVYNKSDQIGKWYLRTISLEVKMTWSEPYYTPLWA